MQPRRRGDGMQTPTLFRDRPRSIQVILGGVGPLAVRAVAGLGGGALYGSGLLVAHAIAGPDATVSRGSFPPLLPVVTAIIGMLLVALGGRLARAARERAEARAERELARP